MREPTKEGINNGNKTKDTIQNGEYREQCQSKRAPKINAVGKGGNEEEVYKKKKKKKRNIQKGKWDEMEKK